MDSEGHAQIEKGGTRARLCCVPATAKVAVLDFVGDDVAEAAARKWTEEGRIGLLARSQE